jgi:hypothetical protein
MLRLRLSQWLLSVLIPTKGAIAQRASWRAATDEVDRNT